MHDLEFDHLHYIPDDEVNEVAWATDNVELRTVGIDIGSSTSHLMFSLVHLQRLGTALSSRFVVIKRQVLWQSPIKLTPYLPDYTIDTDDLAEFFGGCYHLAQVDPDDVNSGAVILTGEAIKRHNARAIAELFSEVSGTFVCASAGHHMECQMAAHGSGAVAMSRGNGNTVLNVDIGGGTTKLAWIENGEIIATIAIAVGGRLIVEDKTGMTRIEEPVRELAKTLGIDLTLGKALAPEDRAAHRRTHGAPAHAHDRPPAAGRALAAAPGHRPVAAPSSPTRPSTPSRSPAASPNISTSARSAISATSAPTCRRGCATCWRAARICRRSGTRARASAPP